jgi:hypothetical protein
MRHGLITSVPLAGRPRLISEPDPLVAYSAAAQPHQPSDQGQRDNLIPSAPFF